MIYKEAYQYNDGSIAFTYDGEEWYIQDNNDNVKRLRGLDMSKVVYKIK